MQGYRQSGDLGVGMTDREKTTDTKRSLIGKIVAPFAKFINWLAKAQENNPPCVG